MMNIKRFYGIVLLLVLLIFSINSLFPSVTAQRAPTFASVNDKTLVVDPLLYEHVKLNHDFMFHVHVYNATNGVNLSNSTIKCSYHLYNSTGNHLLRNNNMGFDGQGFDFEANILGGNFSTPGHYAIEIWCVNGTVAGGSERLFFDVTYSGHELSDSQGTIYSIMLLAFIIMILGLVYFAHSIEPSDERDEYGQIVGINWLKHMRPVLYGMVWLLVMLCSYIAGNISYAYLPESFMGNTFLTVFRVMMIISIVALPYTFVMLIAKLLKDAKLSTLIKQGIIR